MSPSDDGELLRNGKAVSVLIHNEVLVFCARSSM